MSGEPEESSRTGQPELTSSNVNVSLGLSSESQTSGSNQAESLKWSSHNTFQSPQFELCLSEDVSVCVCPALWVPLFSAVFFVWTKEVKLEHHINAHSLTSLSLSYTVFTSLCFWLHVICGSELHGSMVYHRMCYFTSLYSVQTLNKRTIQKSVCGPALQWHEGRAVLSDVKWSSVWHHSVCNLTSLLKCVCALAVFAVLTLHLQPVWSVFCFVDWQ